MKDSGFIKKITVILVAILIFTTGWIKAQDEKSTGKKNATIELRYTNENAASRKVKVKVFRKEGKEYIPIKWAIVNLYLNEDSRNGMLGNVTTDENGEGIIPLDKKFNYVLDSLKTNEFNFIGSLQNNPEIEDTQSELTIKSAQLNIDLTEEDSVRKVVATLMAPDENGIMKPVPDVEIYFAVKRMFNPLPIAEDPVTTDENGVAELEFPANIKGDTLGNVTVLIKVDENEEFGTLIASKQAKWGIPLHPAINKDNRFLWSSRKNAPWSLVIVSNLIIIGVWGVIGYVVVQIFRLKKLNN